MTNTTLVIWVFTALLLVGGVVGLLKAGSKVSLIMAIATAIPLVLVALGQLPLLVAQVDVGFLFVVFSIRYAKTKKVMPAAVMALLSLVTLGALLLLQKTG